MNNKRIVVLFLVLAVVAVAAAGGWKVGSSIVSPAEAAARTAPPTPSPILVPVEERVLSTVIVTRGTARFGLPKTVSIAPSALKPKPGLISTLPLRNTQLAEGNVMLTASGRPVFVLQGQIPAFRDLVPGITGKDVRQLEEGLKRLGFDPGPVDGTFDQQTSEAVARWYQSAGWEAFGPTADQLAFIRTLEESLGEATKIKLAADNAAAAAALAVEAARSTADHKNRVVAAEIAAKFAARDRAKAESEGGTPLAVQVAKAQAELAIKQAAADLAAKIAERDRLLRDQKDGVSLAVETARAKAKHGDDAAAADIAAKIAERAVVMVNPASLRTERTAAEYRLEVARAAAKQVQLEGELAIQEAERVAVVGPKQLEVAEAAVKAAELVGELAIQSAEREVQLALERFDLADAAIKAAQLEGQVAIQTAVNAQKVDELEVKLTNDKVDRIAADLELAKRKVGVQVPVDEIAFIPALPVRVEQLTANIGDGASGPLMSVTDNQVVIDSSLPLDAAPLVKPNMQVRIDETALSIKATGVVKRVADTPGTFGVDGYHIYFEVSVNETPHKLEGFSLRLTIPIESTSGAVIAVPLSALSLSADGTSRVQVQNGDKLDYMVVEPGMTADGYVEVKPVTGTLAPGTSVVVGYEAHQGIEP